MTKELIPVDRGFIIDYIQTRLKNDLEPVVLILPEQYQNEFKQELKEKGLEVKANSVIKITDDAMIDFRNKEYLLVTEGKKNA